MVVDVLRGEGIIVYKLTSHLSNIKTQPLLGLLLVHLRGPSIDSIKVFKADSCAYQRQKKLSGCILVVQDFYVGWMRGKLLYNNSLPSYSRPSKFQKDQHVELMVHGWLGKLIYMHGCYMPRQPGPKLHQYMQLAWLGNTLTLYPCKAPWVKHHITKS